MVLAGTITFSNSEAEISEIDGKTISDNLNPSVPTATSRLSLLCSITPLKTGLDKSWDVVKVVFLAKSKKALLGIEKNGLGESVGNEGKSLGSSIFTLA